MKRLYRPDKYHVMVGEGKDGLCTTWSDVEILAKQFPELRKRFALIGTLYSREGVSVIVRNLALNPDIRRVYLWAHSPLAKTEIGKRGWETLKEVWEGNLERLDKGIDRKIAEKIIRNVELVDVSEERPENLMSLKEGDSRPYMQPVSFPDPPESDETPFPSEEVGFLVRGEKLIEAWAKGVDMVMRYGRVKETEYGMKEKELSAVMWVFGERIEDFSLPEWDRKMMELTGLSGWEEYAEFMIKPEKDESVSYTYGNRLREFFGVDQVDWIIKKLKTNPETRRAVATTYYPPADEYSSSPPCLIYIQFLERNGKLDMFAVFRSHDMMKAALLNALGLMKLHKHVSEAVGMERGIIAITSYSAHIYESEWEVAKRTVNCYSRSQKPVFTESDIDPRGSLLIRIHNGKIIAEISAGERKIEIEGKTAKEIAYRIAKLNLLSMPMHYAYLGMELEKAEMALKLGIPYKQDRPLNLSFSSNKDSWNA